MGRDGSVGIATGYKLDGPGIESRCGRGFPYPCRPALGSNQPHTQWVTGLFPGIKAAGAWRWPLTSSSAEIQEIVEWEYSHLGLPGLFKGELHPMCYWNNDFFHTKTPTLLKQSLHVFSLPVCCDSCTTHIIHLELFTGGYSSYIIYRCATSEIF